VALAQLDRRPRPRVHRKATIKYNKMRRRRNVQSANNH
jgi:hypothetical protein